MTGNKKVKWYELTDELRSKGYESINVNDRGFGRPASDDWKTVNFWENCVSISFSEKLKKYTILASGD